MTLFKDKINYKLPNGNGFHAHVDYHAYSHIGQVSHVTANVAVDEATVANGCLEVVPGSHNVDIDFSNGGRISPEWENAHEWVTVPLRPGDVLFFGSHLAHRSKPNGTDKSRTSLYATYNMVKDGADLRSKYYAHRREIFPPDHGKSLSYHSRNCVTSLEVEKEANMHPERKEGTGYEQGWKTYGFAAPFSATSVH